MNEHSSKGRELSAAGVGGGRRGRVDERVAAHVPGRAHVITYKKNELILQAVAYNLRVPFQLWVKPQVYTV